MITAERALFSGRVCCLIGLLEVDTRRLRLLSVVCHPQELIGEIYVQDTRDFSLATTTLQSRCVVIFTQNNPDIRLSVFCHFDYGPLLAYAT